MPPGLRRLGRRGRERLTALLADEPDERWDEPVRACPGWTVRGVVSHLLGTVEDALAGRITGPPGAGKSMLAQRLPSILPPLNPRELLDVSMIQSIAGELEGEAREVVVAGAGPHGLAAHGLRRHAGDVVDHPAAGHVDGDLERDPEVAALGVRQQCLHPGGGWSL